VETAAALPLYALQRTNQRCFCSTCPMTSNTGMQPLLCQLVRVTCMREILGKQQVLGLDVAVGHVGGVHSRQRRQRLLQQVPHQQVALQTSD
jgi:hypothetical protein